jgi:hypothetical protein
VTTVPAWETATVQSTQRGLRDAACSRVSDLRVLAGTGPCAAGDGPSRSAGRHHPPWAVQSYSLRKRCRRNRSSSRSPSCLRLPRLRKRFENLDARAISDQELQRAKVEGGFLLRAGCAGLALLSHWRVGRPRDWTSRRMRAPDRVAQGRRRPEAPTDPYVPILEHTVLQPTDSPSPKGPRGYPSGFCGHA